MLIVVSFFKKEKINFSIKTNGSNKVDQYLVSKYKITILNLSKMINLIDEKIQQGIRKKSVGINPKYFIDR